MRANYGRRVLVGATLGIVAGHHRPPPLELPVRAAPATVNVAGRHRDPRVLMAAKHAAGNSEHEDHEVGEDHEWIADHDLHRKIMCSGHFEHR